MVDAVLLFKENRDEAVKHIKGEGVGEVKPIGERAAYVELDLNKLTIEKLLEKLKEKGILAVVSAL